MIREINLLYNKILWFHLKKKYNCILQLHQHISEESRSRILKFLKQDFFLRIIFSFT
jgi:hypothetical protein